MKNIKKEANKEYIDLFNMAKNLKKNEELKTSFGPCDTYYIERFGKDFRFTNTENYYRNKTKFAAIFNSAEQLMDLFDSHPEMYAKNVFSGELTHMDNWVNMVKSFRVVKKDK